MAQKTPPPTPDELRTRIFEKPGFMKNAVTELKALEAQLKSGDISQGDYVSLVEGIIPEVNRRSAGAGASGSGAIEELKRQGISDFKNIKRDFEVYKAGRDLLGRDITEKELTQIRPRFGTGRPKDIEQGLAYVAELAGQEENSPANLAKKAPQFGGQVNETFKNLLGRDATASESDFYGRMLASGDVSPYEVEQRLKAGEEYQGQRDKAFRGELAGELGGYRKEALADATEDILSRYQKMGGGHRSSNLDFAMADATKDLEGRTEQYLSGISASQYGGNKATARADYENMLGQYLEGSKYKRGRQDSYMDMLTNRAYESMDYERQMQDYMNFLNSQPKKKSGGMGGMIGTLAGVGIGGLIGGPAGATAGGQFGQAAGGIFDYRSLM